MLSIKPKRQFLLWGGAVFLVCFLISAILPANLVNADTFNNATWNDPNYQYNGGVRRVNLNITSGTPWYAYVAQGERLSYSFKYNETETGSSNSVGMTITVIGPNGTDSSMYCKTYNTPATCTKTSAPASKSGIWTITPVGDQTNMGSLAPWHISVIPGGSSAAIPGRVWTNRVYMTQSGDGFFTSTANITFYYLRNDGYLYRVQYPRYHGIQSLFDADVSGNVPIGKCESAYRSFSSDNIYDSNTAGKYHIASNSCKGRFRIYLTNPGINSPLPVTAALFNANGTASTTWLNPKVQPTEISNISFATNNTLNTNSTAAPYDGKIGFTIANYIGNTGVHIVGSDSNNISTCDFSAANVRKISKLIADPNPDDGVLPLINSTIDFDGKDGLGGLINNNYLCIKVLAANKGEMHTVNGDVERRDGGIVIERLTGSITPQGGEELKWRVMWDDSFLNTSRCSITPKLKQLSPGVDSNTGVHGWGAKSTSGANCVLDNASNQRTTTWGNVRYIDDWTYDLRSATDSVMVFTQPRPNLLIEKIFSDDVLRVGHNGNVQITVKNDGDYWTTGNIVVTDNMPDSLRINGTPTVTDGTCSVSGQTITCTSNKNLQSNNDDSIIINISITPVQASELTTNTATVTGGGDLDCPTGSTSCSSSATITTVTPELHISKTVSDSDVASDNNYDGNDDTHSIIRVGHPFTYTLKATNTGTVETEGRITIKDTLDSSFTNVSATIDGNSNNCSVTTNNSGSTEVSCFSDKVVPVTTPNSTNIAANEQIEVIITATPNEVISNIPNTAYITGGDDGNCPDNSLSCNSNQVLITTVTPELHIIKTMDSGIENETEHFVVGHQGKYILTVTNEGSIATNGVITVTDQIPEHFNIDESGLTPGCSVTNQSITCNRSEPLGLDDTWTIHIPVTPTATINEVNNKAYTHGGDDQTCKDQTSAENTERCNSETIHDLKHAELTIEKSVETKYTTDNTDDADNIDTTDKLPVILLGETVKYLVKVTNTGNYRTMTDSYIVDYLPDSVELVLDDHPLPDSCHYTAEDHTITCLIPTGFEPEQTEIFELYVKSRAITGNITNNATIDGDDLDCVDQTAAMNVQRCNSTTTTPAFAPKLSIEKTSDLKLIQLGDTITYYLTIKNHGNYKTVSKYRITDQLPAQLSFISVKVMNISNDIIEDNPNSDNSNTDNNTDTDSNPTEQGQGDANNSDSSINNDTDNNTSTNSNTNTDNNTDTPPSVGEPPLPDSNPESTFGVTCNNQNNTVDCIMSEGLNPSGEVTIAITAKAINADKGIKNTVTVAGECAENDPDCIEESICIADDKQWLSNEEDYNDSSRCTSNTTIDIDSPPEPPQAGVVRLISGAVSVLILFAVGVWLMRGKRGKLGQSSTKSAL